MMMELSCSSSPISIHSPVNQLHRRVYLHSHRRNVAFLWPSSSSSASTSTSSSSSSFYGFSISRKTQNLVSSKGSRSSRSNRLFYVACGVFEKFTERAVKAVMFSQREAKALGAEMVFTQHLLLGLIAEDRAAGGFLGSGIKVDVAREVVKRTWHSVGDGGGDGDAAAELGSATDMPFSPSTKRVFEAAVEYSRTMGYNFIAPEHIAIGLFTVDDGSAGRVLKR